MVRFLRINQPIMHTFLHHDVVPDKILYNGSKIMYRHVAKGLDLTFLDSLNFLGMRLSKLPGCFDLNELCKGYFPHLFNTSENQHYVGPHPDTQFYSCDYMESGDREQFLEWDESKKDKIFDFQKEIHEYCVSEVDIPRRGCMKFRNLLMEVTSTRKRRRSRSLRLRDHRFGLSGNLQKVVSRRDVRNDGTGPRDRKDLQMVYEVPEGDRQYRGSTTRRIMGR